MTTAFVIIVIVLLVVAGARKGLREQEQRNEGAQKMVCPHCQTAGTVSLRPTKVKRGISGGKATGAVLTGGLSLLATGLSRKEKHLRACCSNCGVDWLI